jgi:hypothetical protein
LCITASVQKNGAATVSLDTKPDVATVNCCNQANAPTELGIVFSEFRSDCRQPAQNRIFGDYFRLVCKLVFASLRNLQRGEE